MFSVIMLIEQLGDAEERERIRLLYEYYSLRLPGYIQKRFGFTKEDIEDAIEMIFERLIRYRKTLMELSENEELRFVLTVCRSVCLDMCKKHKREQKYLSEWPGENALSDTDKPFDNELLQREEDHAHIRFILNLLRESSSPTYEIFVLKYIEKKKNTEIAARLCLNPSTVSTILHRTIKKIQKELGYTYE